MDNKNQISLSIIIPAYNEEFAIGETVKKLVAEKFANSEILVIDDGSKDKTASIAEAAGAFVIKHPYNIGYGAALKTGIRSSRGKVLVFIDGDGQHNPQDIPRLLKNIPTYHMVVGARQRESQAHLHRNFANAFYNKFASFIAQFKVEDLTSGFRAIRRVDAVRFCDMFPNAFSASATSTLAFIRSGRSLKYIPIVTTYRVGKSKIKLLRDGFEFLMIITKIGMLFSPFRVFLPISSLLFFFGLGRYAQTYFYNHTFTNMAALLLNSAVIVFMLGLIAEQIASIRMERGDRLFSVEDASLYEEFKRYGEPS